MNSNKLRTLAFILAVPGGAAGYFLRLWQLRQTAGPAGGDTSILWLGLFCAVIVALLALQCARLRRQSAYEEVFSSNTGPLLVSVAAAAMLMAASALQLLQGLSGIQLVICFLGLASGLSFVVTAAQRYRGVVPPAAVHVLPCIYLVIRLIIDFRQWSVDPAVLDYCFELFAAIAAMCAVYHLGAFCYNRGGRRISAFWCMTAMFFSAVAMVGCGLVHTLLIGSLGLWAGVNGWQLMENG